MVIVKIYVDRKGKVFKASALPDKSTIKDNQVLILAEEKAKESKFAPNPDAPLITEGYIMFHLVDL